jgi:hypothetical protein
MLHQQQRLMENHEEDIGTVHLTSSSTILLKRSPDVVLMRTEFLYSSTIRMFKISFMCPICFGSHAMIRSAKPLKRIRAP